MTKRSQHTKPPGNGITHPRQDANPQTSSYTLTGTKTQRKTPIAKHNIYIKYLAVSSASYSHFLWPSLGRLWCVCNIFVVVDDNLAYIIELRMIRTKWGSASTTDKHPFGFYFRYSLASIIV